MQEYKVLKVICIENQNDQGWFDGSWENAFCGRVVYHHHHHHQHFTNLRVFHTRVSGRFSFSDCTECAKNNWYHRQSHFPYCFSSLESSLYSSLFSLSFNFILNSAGTTISPIWQVSLFCWRSLDLVVWLRLHVFIVYLVHFLTVYYQDLRNHIRGFFVVYPRHSKVFPSRLALLEDELINV